MAKNASISFCFEFRSFPKSHTSHRLVFLVAKLKSRGCVKFQSTKYQCKCTSEKGSLKRRISDFVNATNYRFTRVSTSASCISWLRSNLIYIYWWSVRSVANACAECVCHMKNEERERARKEQKPNAEKKVRNCNKNVRRKRANEGTGWGEMNASENVTLFCTMGGVLCDMRIYRRH